ncbi:MAG: hypothetical protein ACOC3V_03510 [bacterium]
MELLLFGIILFLLLLNFYFYYKFNKINNKVNSQSYLYSNYINLSNLRSAYEEIFLKICQNSYKMAFHEYIIFLIHEKNALDQKDIQNGLLKMIKIFETISGKKLLDVLVDVYGDEETLISNIRVVYYDWFLSDKIIQKLENYDEIYKTINGDN